MTMNECDLYLRLSDGRVEEALEGRETRLRAKATEVGWQVRNVIVENDVNGDGTIKKASRMEAQALHPAQRACRDARVVRQRFRDELLPDMMNGINVIAEYADRIARDHRDGLDFLEAAEIGGKVGGGNVISLNGSFTLTDGGTRSERAEFRREIDFAERTGQDKSDKATTGRERWAGKSYQGGRRPFGFRGLTPPGLNTT